MRKSILLLFILPSFVCHAQIFRFNHIVSQDAIQNASFTLHQATPIIVHDTIFIINPTVHNLTKGIADTITTRAIFIINATKPISIRYAGAVYGTFSSAPGIQTSLTEGSEFIVPANTNIEIQSNKRVFVKSDDSQCSITISTTDTSFRNRSSFIHVLRNNTIRLTAKTKGIITVSGGKITFDPWQITSFVNPPAGANDINAGTTLPLELKDNRTRISDPTKVLKVPYKHFTISINSIPFRYRGRRILGDSVHASGTVATALSLALSMGHTWGISSITSRARHDYSFTVGLFAGPSTVDIRKETVDNPADFVAGRTNPVLSYGINTIFARNGLGFLFALGFDKAYGKFGKNWIYNNRPWVGFGISAGFPR